MMTTAQHFLLSAESRSLSLKEIYKGGEEKAYDAFKRLRWASTQGEPVCRKCGCLDHYDIPTRRKFKCAACGGAVLGYEGTIFALAQAVVCRSARRDLPVC
ncbi:hypothetical protein X751_16235 [Mesorhizobium sp. LNJC395A00]|nr:hypothetical protein X751_16235 [Mesorhizobium sp. LNJC395A00]